MPSQKVVVLVSPLGLWLLWLIARRAFGHKPTRASVTVGLSLLTLLYFLVVVGTGIFWVATQELPVFDWHYLPGYLLLALTLTHVVLHWRNVAVFLRRRSPSTLVQADGARFKAWVRATAYVVGVGAAATLVFLMGMRQGGRQITIIGGADTQVASDFGKGALIPVHMVRSPAGTVPLAQLYHEGSSYPAHAALPGLTVKSRPEVYESYEGAATALPEAKPAGDTSVLQAYEDWRTGHFRNPDAKLTISDLSLLLYHAQGVSQTIQRRGMTFDLRTAPSAGALYPVNLYVAAIEVVGLEPGLYYYHPKRGQLVLVKAGTSAADNIVSASGSLGTYESAPAIVVLTTTFARTAFKYEERAYRYVAMDTGHAAYNLSLGAASIGWRAPMIARFDDAAVEAALGVDRKVEAPLLLVPIGKAEKAMAEPLFAPERMRTESASFVDLIHGGSAMRIAGGTGPFPAHAASSPGPSASDVALPAPAQGLPLLEAIRARRSEREYVDRPMTMAELAALLAVSAGERKDAPTVDPLLSSSAPLSLYAVVRNVEGLAGGVYRYLPGANVLQLRRPGDFAAVAESACVQQEFCRTADVVFVKTVRWTELFLPDGDRGYRYANLRAGVVGEGLYVQGAALGLGVCGVGAFGDSDVAALLGIDAREEAPLYITAVGKRK
jgi:SagB-type dehydrogenase family enzyme